MKLLISQKNMLADFIEAAGADINCFDIKESELYGSIVCVRNDVELLFNFRTTIQDAEFCDIYYRPTNKQPCKHIYLSIDTFEEALPYFQEWLDCLSLEVGVEDKWEQTE
ncbi:MAG: hypothetical protein II990_03890 [Muribaculaceae bacterium]|nr:hypothetical protein [Muribaculaceae bacterium]